MSSVTARLRTLYANPMRWVAALAAMLMLLNVLAPAMAQARALALGQPIAIEVCTAQGLKSILVQHDSAPSPEQHDKTCPYCQLHHAPAVLADVAPSHDAGQFSFAAPTCSGNVSELAADWRANLARGPPSF